MGNYNHDNKIRRRKINSKSQISSVNNEKTQNITGQKLNTNREKIKREYRRYERDNIDIEESKYRKMTRTRYKKHKKNEFYKKLIKYFMVFVLIISVIGSLAGSILVYKLSKDSPIVTKELLEQNYISTEVAKKSQIPQNLKNALVSIEDERFYKHNGVDIISLVRSTIHNLTSEGTQGGSTIEMQISKNLLTTENKTLKRKIQDMYNAFQMDKHMTKDEIITVYLNNMYLGKSAYGAASGSKKYFGVEISKLNLAQCAMLVGITNNPARYINHGEALQRKNIILYKMHQLGYITDEEYENAKRDQTPFVSDFIN